MAIYGNYDKLGRVKLPNNNIYALIDVDGRALIAPKFSDEATYLQGDHVVYNDNLYRAKTDIATAGAWDSTKWDNVTVDTELKRLESIISGGIHYRGKTTTSLFDGATTNPITIDGESCIVIVGDLVILDLATVSSSYAIGVAYPINQYIKNDNLYYIVDTAITSTENTSFEAIRSKLTQITSEPEFLFDGNSWALLGSISTGLGSLAFKDTASGTYVKPTGYGSVTIKNYTKTQKYLERTTITGTNGTVNASEVTGGTSKNQWKQDATNPTVVYGTADVGTAVTYGTANPGTAITGVAKVGAQKTFNVDGIKLASTPVDDDCLIFTTASTENVIGIADATGVSITPAVASSSTLTPAVAANSSRTINNLVADGTLTGSYTITARTPAAIASSATYVATGGVKDAADGALITTDVTQGTEPATVSVGTSSDTVVVK